MTDDAASIRLTNLAKFERLRQSIQTDMDEERRERQQLAKQRSRELDRYRIQARARHATALVTESPHRVARGGEDQVSTDPFRFLALPGELRNMIYLASFDASWTRCITISGRRQFLSDDRPPPLCSMHHRQLRRESQSLFYATTDLLLNIWPHTVSASGPEFSWLGADDDGSTMRRFRSVRFKATLFDMSVRQSPYAPLRIEHLVLHPLYGSPSTLAGELTQGVADIDARGGFTPRFARALVMYLLLKAAMTQAPLVHWRDRIQSLTMRRRGLGVDVPEATGGTLDDFLTGRVRLITAGTRAVARGLLRAV